MVFTAESLALHVGTTTKDAVPREVPKTNATKLVTKFAIPSYWASSAPRTKSRGSDELGNALEKHSNKLRGSDGLGDALGKQPKRDGPQLPAQPLALGSDEAEKQNKYGASDAPESRKYCHTTKVSQSDTSGHTKEAESDTPGHTTTKAPENDMSDKAPESDMSGNTTNEAERDKPGNTTNTTNAPEGDKSGKDGDTTNAPESDKSGKDGDTTPRTDSPDGDSAVSGGDAQSDSHASGSDSHTLEPSSSRSSNSGRKKPRLSWSTVVRTKPQNRDAGTMDDAVDKRGPQMQVTKNLEDCGSWAVNNTWALMKKFDNARPTKYSSTLDASVPRIKHWTVSGAFAWIDSPGTSVMEI